MLYRPTLEAIITEASHAPSGDNAQPWKFEIKNNSVYLYNVPGKDSSVYNYLERGSMLAHGAVIENMTIAASQHELAGKVTLFPGEVDCTARIDFEAAQLQTDVLAQNIQKRATNRKPYLKKGLEPDDKTALLDAIKNVPDVELHFVEGIDVQNLASKLSLNDRLLFENKGLHEFLFSIIRWNRAEESRNPGLFVKTMEFPLPLQYLLQYVLCNFAVVQFLNTLGFSSFVAQQMTTLYKQSSAFAVFTLSSAAKTEYVSAGRALQRFWLTAQHRGLNCQPVTGLPYLAARISAGEGSVFSEPEQQAIMSVDNELRRLCGVDNTKAIGMVLRIGYGPDPSAVSFKQIPQIT